MRDDERPAVRPLNTPRTPSGRFVIAAATSAAVVLGTAIFILSGINDADEPAQADLTIGTAPETVPSATVTIAESESAPGSSQVLPPTLRELIPDVEATLISVVDRGGQVRLATWSPQSTAANRVPLPIRSGDLIADRVRFDASGTRLAFLGPAAAAGTATLYVGSLSGWTPARVGVTSFVWHQVRPGWISWLEGDLGSEPEALCTARVTPGRRFTDLACIEVKLPVLQLDAYSEGGFLAHGGGEIVRLAPSGEVTDRHEGVAAALGPDGRVLLTVAGGERYLADGPLAAAKLLQWAPAAPRGMVGSTAAWAPKLPQIAFADTAQGYRLQVWSAAGELLASSRALEEPGFEVEWDASGRFVVTVGWTLVHVYDTFADTLAALSLGFLVTDAHLVQPVRCERADDVAAAFTRRLPAGVTLQDAWMVASRDAYLESWAFISATVQGGTGDGQVATWALPGFGGTVDEVNTPNLAIPANAVAEIFQFGDRRFESQDYDATHWLQLDGALHAQGCAAGDGNI